MSNLPSTLKIMDYLKKLRNLSKISLLVFAHDVCMIPIAWLLAYWLRFNLSRIPDEILQGALHTLPTIMVVQAVFYWLFGLYRGVWRFASLPDLLRIAKVVVAGVLVSLLVLFLASRLHNVPRSIFPIYLLLLIAFLSGSRVAYRTLKSVLPQRFGSSGRQRVLIIGAGQAGESLARDLQRQVQGYRVVAFVDDDPKKRGHEIHGVRVLGSSNDIARLVKKHRIDLIIIAIPSMRSAQMRPIVAQCEKTGVPFRTVPSLQDLTSGSVRIDALRQVSLEDLLGRDVVSLDWDAIREKISDKTVLVSGAGGSIGSELCRQVARMSPGRLLVVEQNEFNLYSLTMELQQSFPQLDCQSYLADVTDKVAITNILQQPVDIIFHAAAYKHVPMLENQIRIAMHNNIVGTQVLAEAAVNAHVKKFVLVSTDKAVNPTSIMGATKRAAEIFCQNYGYHSPTQFITVRFGNVLGSAGSVVPLFKKQIEVGGPITVTHPDITRFFMTIPEASQLILQAMTIGQGGEIFVLDMGEPIKIQYLAEQMISLAGLMPHRDIQIQFTGLRPGEKLYEELFHEAEALLPTVHTKILQAQHRPRDWIELMDILAAIEQACERNDLAMLRQLLVKLVPEYLVTTAAV